MRKTTLETNVGQYCIYETLNGVEVYRGSSSNGTFIGDRVVGSIRKLPDSNLGIDYEYFFKSNKDSARSDACVESLVQDALANDPYQCYNHLVIRDVHGDILILPATLSARNSLSGRIEKVEAKKKTRVKAK